MFVRPLDHSSLIYVSRQYARSPASSSASLDPSVDSLTESQSTEQFRVVRRALGSEAIITPAATPSRTVDQLDEHAAIPSSDAAADHTQPVSEDRSDQPDQEEAPTPRDRNEDINRRADTEGHHNT